MASINTRDEITRFDPDVSNELFLRIIANPALGWIPFGAARRADPDMKTVWGEEVRSEIFGTLTANYTPADPTLTVVDSTNFVINDQIHLKNHKDADDQDITFTVTSLPTGTTIAVTLLRGADTLATTAANSVIKIVRGNPDNVLAGTGKFTEPVNAFTFFQLFQRSLELGQNAMDISNAGGLFGSNVFIDGLDQQIQNLTWDIWEAVMHGTGRAGVDTATPAITKSLSETINTTSNLNRVNCDNLTLTETKLNDMIQSILQNGGKRGPKVLLTNLTNMQALSNLRHDKVQYTTETAINNFGGRVEVFVTNFNQIGTVTLIGDENYEDNTALLIDQSSVNLLPIQGQLGGAGLRGTVTDATTPGQFGRKWVIRTQLALQVMQQNRDHGVFFNLAA